MANAGASVMLRNGGTQKAVELVRGRCALAGASPDDLIVVDGGLTLAKMNLNISYAELLARNGLSSLVGTATTLGRGGERPQGNLQLFCRLC